MAITITVVSLVLLSIAFVLNLVYGPFLPEMNYHTSKDNEDSLKVSADSDLFQKTFSTMGIRKLSQEIDKMSYELNQMSAEQQIIANAMESGFLSNEDADYLIDNDHAELVIMHNFISRDIFRAYLKNSLAIDEPKEMSILSHTINRLIRKLNLLITHVFKNIEVKGDLNDDEAYLV